MRRILVALVLALSAGPAPAMEFVIDSEAFADQAARTSPESPYYPRFKHAESFFAEKRALARDHVAALRGRVSLSERQAEVLEWFLAARLFHRQAQCCHGHYAATNDDIDTIKTLKKLKPLKAALKAEGLEKYLTIAQLNSVYVQLLRTRAVELHGSDDVQFWRLTPEEQAATDERVWLVEY